jgi:hypothetical protein
MHVNDLQKAEWRFYFSSERVMERVSYADELIKNQTKLFIC